MVLIPSEADELDDSRGNTFNVGNGMSRIRST